MRLKFNKLTCLFSIICMVLVICPDVLAESPDFPNACVTSDYDVDLNSSTIGQIRIAGDRDFFRVQVPSAGTLTIYSEYIGSMDPIGALFNDSCTRLAWHDDIDRNGNPADYNFRIVESVSAGTYHIGVKHQSDTGTGWYRLNVAFNSGTSHTIDASAGSGGSITPAGSISVPHNGNQSFTIAPDVCYDVQDVLVDSSSVGAVTSYQFSSITSNHTISASFSATSDYTIAASAGAGGSITPAGSVSVSCGSDQSFSITPDAGYEILDVLVDGVSQGAITSYDFSNVTQNHTITANFSALVNHTITTLPGPNGTITPVGPVSVPDGGSQYFAITADPGYQVDEVWVDGGSIGAVTGYTFNNVGEDHTIEAQFSYAGAPPNPTDCIDISDTPLDVRFRAAPANIMFLLDDSGSMDWEFMTSEDDGLFNDQRYLFDDPGDNVYSGRILDADQRKHWKSQWSGYNRIYYNPLNVYEPWPNKTPADTATPRSHPHHATPTFDLSDEFVFIPDRDTVIVDNEDSEFKYSPASEWTLQTGNSEAYNDTFYESRLNGDVNLEATWSPNLDNGDYKVYVRWRDTSSYYKNAEFRIFPQGSKTDTIYADQSINGTDWNYFGTYNFNPSGFITLFHEKDDAENYRVCADAIMFEPVTGGISISNAHYFTWYDANENHVLDTGETVYLVNFVDNNDDGTLDGRVWYEFKDDGDGIVKYSELVAVSESGVPAIVRPNVFADDLQNFANWYSFFRRRELTATGALAKLISQAQGMQIGIYSINGIINEEVHKIKVNGVDETDTLLDKLYNVTLVQNSTPLRTGLLSVGKYFDAKDNNDDGGIGSSPYASAADGGECQQAFTIIMTDGYYNGAEPWNPEKDYDGDNDPPYKDSYKNTLADVAMYFYEKDLSDLSDLVPTNERDDATRQHMVTYGIGFGVNGTLDPDSYTFKGNDYPTWPDPENGDQEKIDDLWHATVNGRGRFFSAGDSEELLNDLLLILKDIELFSGSASSVSVNGDELYTKINNDVRLFQSKYYSEGWHGDVLSYKIDSVTGDIIEPAIWSAAYQLSLLSANNRKIITYDGTSGGEAFRFDSLTDLQKTALDANWQTDDTFARNVVEYLRGDVTNEVDNGGNLRNRSWAILDPGHPFNGSVITSSKLGDIVHSSPVYKNGVLYSGGNDGMLHAFNAETGIELFAYVPNLVFETLTEYSDPAYTHKYYVDLTPTVEDVAIGNITQMLVGGLGKGGRGYYALNVSDLDPGQGIVPFTENQAANMVMWEYPNLSTPVDEILDMGYSFSKAVIVPSNDTANAPWIVIFGNGYNSPNGHAVLFILDPLTGQLLSRIDTQAGSCNGMSTPIVIDADYDGKVDYAYAGDLNGNLWKFDLTDANYNNWGVAYENAGTPKPLFKTANQPITIKPDVMYHCNKDGYMVLFGTGKYLGDTDISDQSLQAIYGIWDYSDDEDDYEYVGTFDDSNPPYLINTPLSSPPVSLLQQTFVDMQTVNGIETKTLSENNADWRTTTLEGASCGENSGISDCDPDGVGEHGDPLRNVGWYLNLTGAGERVVSDVLVRDGTLIVISYSPGGSVCGTGGYSWVMAMGACSGARLSAEHFDLNGDGVIDDQDLVNIGTDANPIWAPPTGIKFDGRLQPPAIIILNNMTERLYMSSSQGEIETLTEKSAKLGMIHWRIFRP